MRIVLVLFGVAAILVGCVSSAGASPEPSVGPSSPAPTVDLTPPPSPTTSASPTTGPSPTPATAPASSSPVSDHPSAAGWPAGTVVATLADEGLRVRSQPSVGDDSERYEPLLALGTELLVLGGPVSASGYAWYQIVPLTSVAPSLEYWGSDTLPSGWVASAGKDGEPWLGPVDFPCPPVPTDYRSLDALPPAVGLACFPRVPITVEARLIWCNCDIDGPWFTPFWFSRGGGTDELLVTPEATSPPADDADWFLLNLDPAGEHPDVLPIGEVVEVTGIFDHPAAASCTWTEMGGEPVPSQGCRLEFAVTRLLVK
jgi:hypothetical protein